MSPQSPQNGSALILAVVILVLTASMGAVMARLQQGAGLSQWEQLEGGASFQLAEATLQLGMTRLSQNACNPAAFMNATPDPGRFTKTYTWGDEPVELTVTRNSEENNQFTLTARELTGNHRRTLVLAPLHPGSSSPDDGNCRPWPPPVLALGGLTVGNNARVNDSPVQDFMDPDRGGIDINGQAWNVTDSTFPPLPPFPPNSGADGPIGVANNESATRPPGHYTTVVVDNGATLTLTGGGDYHINSLTLSNTSTLNLAPGTYWIGSLSDGNNARVIISPPGEVRLQIQSSLTLNNNSDLNVGGSGAENLVVTLHGNATMENNCNFTGLLIAPNPSSSITIRNNGEVNGAVATAGTLTLRNNAQVNSTDPALSRMVEEGVSATMAGGSGGGGAELLTAAWRWGEE